MNKKMMIVCFVVIGLFMSGFFVSLEVGAADYVPYRCVVPYNIKVGSWNTGIHITANYHVGEEFKIYFSGGGQANYKIVTLKLADYPGGWTGWIEDLFNLPEYVSAGTVKAASSATFISPSYLIIYSTKGWFTVSQFMIDSVNGFGFQTYYAWPQASYWPYQSPTSAESLFMGTRKEDNGTDRLEPDID